MNPGAYIPPVCRVDAAKPCRQIVGTSLLFVSTAGREAGSAESASAFVTREEEGIPRISCRESGANKRHPAFAGRRADDAITGGLMAER